MRNSMFLLHQALFYGGITVAIAAGAKLSPVGLRRLTASEASPALLSPESWPTTWPVFVGGLLAGLIGLVLWRAERNAEKRRRQQLLAGRSDSPHVDATALIMQMLEPFEQFTARSEILDADELMKGVDELGERFLLPIVSERQDVLHRFGMQRGAEILIAVAYAERMLNRCWSAAADGYVEEARDSLQQALAGWQEVQQLVMRYSAAPA